MLGEWALPAKGPVTSQVGMRRHPTLGITRPHNGDDISAACGEPIYAASAGTVVQAGPAAGFGHWIVLQHPGGVQTVYGHMFASGVYTRAGQTVRAGQVIGAVGRDGESTGCHLHFEYHQGAQVREPLIAMHEHGITLGAER